MKPIDADALCEALKDWRGDADDIDENDVHEIVYYQAMSRAIRISEGAPTLDCEPVRHASWIRQDDTYTRFQCGECKSTNFDRRWVFCPLCGAKMDGGKKDA